MRNELKKFFSSLGNPLLVLLPEKYLVESGIFVKGQSGQYISTDYLNRKPEQKQFIHDLEKLLNRLDLLGNTIIISKGSNLLREKAHESFHWLWVQFNNSNDSQIQEFTAVLQEFYNTCLNEEKRSEIDKALILFAYNPKVKAEEFWAHLLQTLYSTRKLGKDSSFNERYLKKKIESFWRLPFQPNEFYNWVFRFFDNLSPEIDLTDNFN